MPREERYVDCERCGERFVGEEAIAGYLREEELPLGGTSSICVGCLERQLMATKWCFKCQTTVDARVHDGH